MRGQREELIAARRRGHHEPAVPTEQQLPRHDHDALTPTREIGVMALYLEARFKRGHKEMGLFSRKPKHHEPPSPRQWGGGAGALARSTRLTAPEAMAALEARCVDGETILGVVDGHRLFYDGMKTVEGTTVLTDQRIVFIQTGGRRVSADAVPLREIRELGARRGYFEVVLAPGPPSDLRMWWLRVGPEEHLAPFAALVMSSPEYVGDR